MHPGPIQRKMGGMRRGAVLVVALLAAVSLSGCGAPSLATATVPTPAGGFTSAAPADTSTEAATLDPTTGLMGPTFPLTVRRTGGIADFHDTIMLRANGTLTVDSDEFAGRTCTLDGADRTSLVGALSTLQPTAPGADTPQSSDTNSNPIPLTISDARDRPFDISDPSLGEIRSSLSALVSDVTLLEPTSTKCTTPSATATSGP
jgi:hypothetical protein